MRISNKEYRIPNIEVNTQYNLVFNILHSAFPFGVRYSVFDIRYLHFSPVTWLAILWITASQAYGQDIVFNKLSINNGLSNNSIFSIAQDNKGFMWFGTREGLNRYDGSTILTFYADPRDTTRLAASHVTALEASDDDLIYIGTAQGLHTYSQRLGTFQRIYFNREKAGYISKMIKTADGALLAGGTKGLLMLRPGAKELVQLIDGNVVDVVEFKHNVFWVATLQKIVMINAEGEVLREYTTVNNAAGHTVSLNDNIFCLFKDSGGEFWLGCKKDGLFRYNTHDDAFLPIVTRHRSNPLEANAVRIISEDNHKRLWIGTETGLFIYDRVRKSFQYYTQSFDQSPATLSDKAIYAIRKSRDGIMWIGTYFGGVNIVKPLEKGFKSLTADGGHEKLSGKAISDIIQDKHGRLWIATEDGGVNIWDRRAGTLSYINNASGNLNINNVHALYEDANDIVWIGTFLGGVNRYDLKRKTMTVYKRQQEELAAFTNNMVYAIHRDRKGTLWIGTTGGLNTLNLKTGTYEPFKPEVFNGKFVYEIGEERSGGLWICVMNSDSLFHYDPATAQLSKYRYHDPALSSTQGCISMLEDSEGQMWFGTMNRGLVKFDRKTNKFTPFNVANGLPNNYVYGVLEDAHGNLWMSTNKGLSRFNKHEQVFTNYDLSHGLPNNQFNFKSAFKDRDGWMYFGTINGLCYFHPDSLRTNHEPPTIYLSDIKLFNKSVPVGQGTLLVNTIDATQDISLSYEDNVITLEFGAINYYSPGYNQYAYYLEGFERDWNYVDGKSNATYTNLSPGNYTFKVKAANNDGYWSKVRTLHVHVSPPFWLSAWAWGVYAVLVIALFFAYKSFLNYRNREKMAVQLERLEKEKINAINQHKLNFFTYISHEFKTPLTLIMASIDKFLLDRSVSEEQSAGYASIRRSAKRLHVLIDQLMEFRRIETDHARMNYVNGDIIRFLRDTFMAFQPLFAKKHIDHYFNTDTTAFTTDFDADKLEKIITNLLSNAVKYTGEQGVIDMEVIIKAGIDLQPDRLMISIQDTGVGMGPEELANIFTVFYQTDHGKKSGSGTGIGLALVKGLVDFMKGTIEIKSAPHTGTQVMLTLPLPRQVEKTQITLVEGNTTVDVEHVLPLTKGQKDHAAETQPQYQMLIVEDSEELIDFLGDHFNTIFKISKAGNGAVALEKIRKSAPDIIVSDVMMPEMDGIELCQAVKSDLSTSHISMVLLTAKTTFENRLDGLDAGADAYLAKPFSLKELSLVVKNLLSSRDRLRTHFLKFGSVKEIEFQVTNRDQDFMLKLTQIVEKHIDNSEFTITRFAEEAAVSRSLLHLKLKKLVNLSASEFIRHIRLQKAAVLLRTTDLNISEVADKVGYADSNYFSRSFKETFSVNPTEYKAQSSPPSTVDSPQ
jgi:signal transduction histidine kinase/ligand-binding sensor domain-containing protein/DNA-binding response OmpR family regulator